MEARKHFQHFSSESKEAKKSLTVWRKLAVDPHCLPLMHICSMNKEFRIFMQINSSISSPSFSSRRRNKDGPGEQRRNYSQGLHGPRRRILLYSSLLHEFVLYYVIYFRRLCGEYDPVPARHLSARRVRASEEIRPPPPRLQGKRRQNIY